MELTTTMRQKVERAEKILEQLPQVECAVSHHFAPGVYARELRIPAGTIATGAVHKTEHLSILVGHCMLTTDEGPREFSGHNTFVSKPGAKRMIVAISDVVMTTIHPTEEKDLDKLCELLTETTSAQLIGGKENRQMLINKESEALK